MGINNARAASWSITQQSVSSFISGGTGASLTLAMEIARKGKFSLDAMLLDGDELRPSLPFHALPGWKDCEPEARQRFPHVTAQAFDAVGHWSGDPPPMIDASVIGNLAEVWWKADALRVAKELPGGFPAATDKTSGGRLKDHTHDR